MTQQIINLGTGPDSYTGDNLRTAFTKVNDNFSQLYAGNVGANTTVNVLSANGVATNGNVNAGNVNVQYQVVSNGNVTAAYFIGNGALLTGINATGGSYSNTNVASYLPTYSGNINAAYYFGNGSQLTGINVTANLGNLFIDGPTNQTLTGSAVGSLGLRPFAGNAVFMVLESPTAGQFANLTFQGFTNGLAVISNPQANANLRLSTNATSITLRGSDNHMGFNTNPSTGYDFNFNGEMFANAYYAAAGFPVGYSFDTPLGDTGLSHAYDIAQGNISVLKLRHDSSEVANFYDNLTTILSGNLVISQSGSVFGSFPNAFIQAYSSANTYTQLTWQNLSNASAATGDIVITSDTGTDTTYYIDMGMTGSGYDNSNPDNSLGTSVYPLDGYFYVQGNTGSAGGNLTLGTTTANTQVKILVGGVDDSDIVAKFTSNGLMPGANVTQSLGSSTQRWKDLWLSNSTLYLGDTPITATNGTLSVNGSPVSGSNYSNTNVAAYLPTYTGNIAANIVKNGHTWTFDDTGILTLPGEGVVRSNDDTIILQSYDTGSNIGRGLRVGTSGQLFLEQGANPAWLSVTPSSNNAIIFSADGTSGSEGRDLTLAAGASDSINPNSNSGGDLYLKGGYGSDHSGGGGPGGNVNIKSGLSSDSHAGNVTIATGANTWTFDYSGNVTIPGSIIAEFISSPAAKISGFDINAENVVANNITATSYITTGSAVKLGSGNVGNIQSNYAVAIGNHAGNLQADYAISIGYVAGQYSQGLGGVAVGYDAGQYSQGGVATALGAEAGRYYQSTTATAVGTRAGNWNQGAGAVAIGKSAAENVSNTGAQGFNAIAIGNSSGYIAQGTSAIAIGAYAGSAYQGQYSIAIGTSAGRDPGSSAVQSIGNNSIILNATGSSFAGTTANAFYVTPIRNDVANIGQVVVYNTTSKEVTYSNTISLAGNITAAVIKTTPVAFSSLPSASDAGAGARAFITDANTTVFGAQVGGGGATYMPVFSNGVNWYVG